MSMTSDVLQRVDLPFPYSLTVETVMESNQWPTQTQGNAIVALRCCQLNVQFEDYWEGRRAA